MGSPASPDERDQPPGPARVRLIPGQVAAEQRLLGSDASVVGAADQPAHHLEDEQAPRGQRKSQPDQQRACIPGMADQSIRPGLDDALCTLGTQRPCVRATKRPHRRRAQAKPERLHANADWTRRARQRFRRCAACQRRRHKRRRVCGDEGSCGPTVITGRMEARSAPALPGRCLENKEPGDARVPRQEPPEPAATASAFVRFCHGRERDTWLVGSVQ